MPSRPRHPSGGCNGRRQPPDGVDPPSSIQGICSPHPPQCPAARLIKPRSSSAIRTIATVSLRTAVRRCHDDLLPVEVPVLGVDDDPIEAEPRRHVGDGGGFERDPQAIHRLTRGELFLSLQSPMCSYRAKTRGEENRHNRRLYGRHFLALRQGAIPQRNWPPESPPTTPTPPEPHATGRPRHRRRLAIIGRIPLPIRPVGAECRSISHSASGAGPPMLQLF